MNYIKNTAPDFTEDSVSKLPALHLLQNLGYTYLPPQKALDLRGGRMGNVILEGILVPWLRENNRIRFKGQEVPFTEGNILGAAQALKEITEDGLVCTNEKIYDLLCLGKSQPQSIEGDIKSFTINYIDWTHPENNRFHVTEEYTVEKKGVHETREPDIVLFVNGIPLVVIECKSPNIKDPVHQAIIQHLRNQNEDEIQGLFVYAQLLLVLSKNEAKYATIQTPEKFWSIWREKQDEDKSGHSVLQELINISLSEEKLDELFVHNQWLAREKIPDYGSIQRQVTEQDRLLYALCRPERLLEIVYQYLLFDNGRKKIARYQQYFCVKKILDRFRRVDKSGKRTGGLVWHTQGSGKSLTMVMLAKAIALEQSIPNHKIVLVTDRIDLDDQIYNTFKACGKEVVQARTGKDLADKLETNKAQIVATVIDKFDAALGRNEVCNEDSNIFVLVDEGHRGQYGPRHAKMRRVLPNACYVGFTGTPVMKEDKNTVLKFGGLIDTYTIDQAVEDKAVVPLLYEGRHVEQKVDTESIDEWFERITSDLSPQQVEDLKKKFSSTDQLNKTEQKVMRVAWDIGEHFNKNWKDTGFKAQLVTQDKAAALLYKKYLDEFGMVSSEVLISGPDEPEGEQDIYQGNKETVQRFWKVMMDRYGSERQYNKQIINAFKKAEDPEIIIVVDKLLTGFDEPRNTVLYLTRNLKDHSLLQAIARVNRLFDGKEFGYILDYRGILENLDHALDLYNSLPEFDARDIENVLTDLLEEIKKLPQRYSVLWDTFKEIKQNKDEEAYEQLLQDEERRQKFYERLSAYARTLGIALSSEKFLQITPGHEVDRYRKDLLFFMKLRSSVRQRFSEIVDFGEYENKIQKLLDQHVGTGKVETITPLVNIFDKDAFAQELAAIGNVSSKADTIAHRTAKTIHERMPEDPAFYRKFSELLQQTIQDFYARRIQANEYLKKVTDFMNSVINRTGDTIPDKLMAHEVAKAYYGVVNERIEQEKVNSGVLADKLADAALEIDKIIEGERIVHWAHNLDVQNRMKTAIEDYLVELRGQLEINLEFKEIDEIMEKCIDIAKHQRP